MKTKMTLWIVLLCVSLAGSLHAQTSPESAAKPGMSDQDIWQLIERTAETFPDDPAVIVLDRINTRYKENGAAVTQEEMVIHFRKENVDADYRSLKYDYNPRTALIRFLDVRVFRAAGHTVQSIPLTDVITAKAPADSIFWNFDIAICPLPRFEEGDALYYRIERRGLNLAYLYENEPALGDKDFVPPHEGYFMDTLYFEDKLPLLEKTYVIEGPRSRPLQFAMDNGTMDVSVRFTETDWIYTFQVKDKPAFVEEPFSVDFNEAALKLAVATHPSWEMKSQWSYHHNEPQFVISPEMQAEVDRIIADCKNDECKLFELLHWTAEEIRYLGLDMGEGEGHMVHRTDQIFEERAGVCKDKAAILVSMLRAAGFESYFVMTLAMEQTLDIPADDKFNHGVVAVRQKDNKWLFLDPTWAPQNRPLFNYLEQEQPVLVASPEGSDLMHVPYAAPEQSPFIITANTTLDLNGDARTEMYIETDGFPDGDFRSPLTLRNAHGRTELFWDLLEGVADYVKLEDYSFSDPRDFHQPMKLHIVAEFPNTAMKVKDAYYLTPILTRHLYNQRWESEYLYAADELEKRTHDMALSCTRQIEFHETLTIPSGYSLKEKPETVKIEGPTIDLQFTVTEKNKTTWQIDQLIRIKKRITPPEEYSDLKKAIEKMQELREQTFILVPDGKTPKNPHPLKAHKTIPKGSDTLPAHGAEIKNRQLHLSIQSNGELTERFQSESIVYNEDGRSRFADQPYVVNHAFQQASFGENYTITPSGKRIDVPDTAKNITLDSNAPEAPDYHPLFTHVVSFTGVEFGSHIHSSVERTTQPGEDTIVEYMYSILDYFPIQNGQLTVSFPSGMNIQYQLLGMENAPVETSENGTRTLTWTFENLQPIVPEQYAGPFYYQDPILVIAVGKNPTWEQRITEFRKTFFDFESTSPTIKAHTEKLLKDAVSDADKINALRSFVSKNVNSTDIEPRRFSYRTRTPERILETGYGYSLDRMKLLAALVESAGGRFELCFSGNMDRVSQTVPCLGALPRIFGMITLNGETMGIDLSNPRFAGSDLIGQRGIAVSRSGMRWLEIPQTNPDIDTCQMTLNLKIDTKGKTNGTMDLVYRGAFNPFTSARIKTTDWIKSQIPPFISKPNIKSLDVLTMSSGDDGTHLQCRFEGRLLPEDLTDDLKTLPLIHCPNGFSSQDYEFSGNPVRVNPVFLNSAGTEVNRIEIEYPKEWEIAHLPADRSFEKEFGSCIRRITTRDHSMIYERTLTIPNRIIPAAAYSDWLTLWKMFTVEPSDQVIFDVTAMPLPAIEMAEDPSEPGPDSKE